MIEMVSSYVLFITSIIANRYFINQLTKNNSKNAIKPRPHSLERELFLFPTLFDLQNDKEEDFRPVNLNIDSSLYDYKTFIKMDHTFCEMEMQWNTRLLFQNTPYGNNIIMYYDLYRQAFAYYSDAQLNYETLNLCAMKYVRVFFCRDFFVDSNVLPKSFTSPFNQMKEDEEKREKEEKLKKRKEKQINFDSSVFVQKNNKTNHHAETIPSEEVDKPKPVYKNNFRYLGKIANWYITQPIPFVLSKKKVSISEHYEYIHFKQSQETSKTSPSHSTFLHNLEELLV
jgi:hypothetical protein